VTAGGVDPSGEAPQEIALELERAAQLFNDAHYHQAHEVLDELWERASQRDSDFFKGLIQACIALHHHQQGNPDGARKLYSGHRQYLAGYLPAYRGLDVAGFLAAMQTALAPVVRARPGAEPAFDPERRPRLQFAEMG
jgi:predicted metal-dependent hydrolase